MTRGRKLGITGSKASRLPKAHNVEGDQVSVRRQDSPIVLEPCSKNWDWLRNMVGPVDADFEVAATEARLPYQHPAEADL